VTLLTVGIDGEPIETYSVEPTNLAGYLRPPRRRYASTTMVGRIGSRPSTRGSTYDPAILDLGVRTTGSASTSLEVGRELLNTFQSRMRGLLEIEVADKPGRVRYGLYEPGDAGTFGITLVSPQLEAAGQIICHDPVWYTRVPVIIGAAANTKITVPVGTETGRLKFMLVGAVTEPVVTVEDRTGTTIATMRFDRDDFALLSTEVLVVDWEQALPVTKVTAGVATGAFDALNLDDTMIAIDPDDGATIRATCPIIVTTWKGDLV
jgi:hypothetical protein